MNRINVLSEQEARKIAAGEVVERPASVVKELIENAIDAGATHVTLYVEKAGSQLIRVVDDGCGMSPEDARLCFVNHATSKILALNDLETITSFGFRGEALASISAISKVILITKEKDLQGTTGVHLTCSEGKIAQEQEVVCVGGTDIQVHDLFFNTPVRKKFLKQDETEWNQIFTLFQAFCLSSLGIHFKLFRDEKLILNVPAVTVVGDRAHQLWGHSFAQNLLQIVDAQGASCVRIKGVISNQNFWRYGRQQIFFFVNNRWVKNGELGKALFKGYQNVLPPGRFPAAALFITLNSSLVDVNVHPRKEEVRFVKPGVVEQQIQRLVTQSLEGNVTQRLQAIAEFVHKDASDVVDESLPSMGQMQALPYGIPTVGLPDPWHGVLSVPPKNNQTIVQKNRDSQVQQNVVPVNVFPKNEPVATGKIVGQILNTYILIEQEDGLLIIDQHAAHERILYEKYLHHFEHKDGTQLMFPEILKLNKSHLKIVLGEQEFLQQQGIGVEQIGDDEIAIKTSPPRIQSQSLRELIFEMIAFVEEHENLERGIFRKKLNEHMHSHMSCKMAVKAGDSLTREMMQNILNDLAVVPNRFICVHGRPTMWVIKKDELEKNFRRK